VRFSTRGVQKHHKNFLGEIHVKNFWPKKLRKKKLLSFRIFPSIFFYRGFGRFSAWGAQKYHKKIFKNQPRKTKKI
jgi:hypothetical protein